MNTFCSYFNQGICRSCDLIEVSYVDQIHQKEKMLLDALSGFTLPPLEKTIPSDPINFRNKAKFVVTGAVHSPCFGLTGDSDLDLGKDLSRCGLHRTQITQALPVIKEFVSIANLIPYQISEKKGELKGLIIYSATETDECYLRFILRSREPIDRIKKHMLFLQEKIPGLKVVSVNIQPVPHAILEGAEEIILTEEKFIRYRISQFDFPLGPKSFVQTNQIVARQLYLEAADWLKKLGTKKLIELFCGQGFFTFVAKDIQEAIGVEINKEAVDTANEFAQKHHLANIKFVHADAGNVKNLIEQLNPDTILVNPPRRGLGNAIELLKRSKVSQVIYSSCNHETLAKDLKNISTEFKIERMKIFDMFPQSRHFETLVQLKRINSAG